MRRRDGGTHDELVAQLIRETQLKRLKLALVCQGYTKTRDEALLLGQDAVQAENLQTPQALRAVSDGERFEGAEKVVQRGTQHLDRDGAERPTAFRYNGREVGCKAGKREEVMDSRV